MGTPCCVKLDENPVSRRAEIAIKERYLSRLYDESADEANFPLQGRSRDCEPWNWYLHALNAAHESGNRDEVKRLRSVVGKALVMECGEDYA